MREFQPGDRVKTGMGNDATFIRRDVANLANAVVSRDDGVTGITYPGYWTCTYDGLILMSGTDGAVKQKADPPGQPPNTTDPKKWPFPQSTSTPIEEKAKDDVWARHKAFMRGMR